MSGSLRAAIVVAVVAVATLGEGGASAWSLLVAHLLLAAGFATFAVAFPAAGYEPTRRPVFAWLMFAVLAAAGAVVAPYAYAAWLVLVELVAFGAMAWLVSTGPEVSVRAFPWAVAALASGHGIAALAQKVSGNQRPASTFLNPNHLAAWLAAAALFLAGAAASRMTSPRPRIVYVSAVIVALAGVFVTGSRGAVLGVATGAAVLLSISWGVLPWRARRALLGATAAIVLAAVAGVAIRFRSDIDPYKFDRTRIWAASMRAVLDAPLTGAGPGQFATAARNLNFPRTDTPLRFERGFMTPHSDVLRAMCEFGVPAGLAALASIALLAYEIVRRRGTLTDLERGAAAALSALLAQSLVDDLTTRPAVTMTGAVFAGLLLARRSARAETRSVRARSYALTGLVVLTLGVAELAGYLAWEETRALPRGPLDAGQLEALKRALAWNPMQPDGWQRLSEHFVGDGTSWSVSDYAAAREAAEHARRLQPKDATFTRAAARVEAKACLSLFPFEATRDRAARLYDEASRLAATDATIPFEAARFLTQAGDAKGAARAALQALAVEPKASAPRLLLAQAVWRQDGPAGRAEASRLLNEALALAPREGEVPSSSYDAALRSVDPKLVLALRRELGIQAAP